jgi:hypothetical protein
MVTRFDIGEHGSGFRVQGLGFGVIGEGLTNERLV